EFPQQLARRGPFQPVLQHQDAHPRGLRRHDTHPQRPAKVRPDLLGPFGAVDQVVFHRQASQDGNHRIGPGDIGNPQIRTELLRHQRFHARLRDEFEAEALGGHARHLLETASHLSGNGDQRHPDSIISRPCGRPVIYRSMLRRRDFLAGTLLLAPAWARGRELRCDVAVIGAGVGGCAAALAAARNGLRVVLTEETEWIGGQLTSQAVPPDEHPWIESFGSTLAYREYRTAVRDCYRRHYPLTEAARSRWNLNPGGGSVS